VALRRVAAQGITEGLCAAASSPAIRVSGHRWTKSRVAIGDVGSTHVAGAAGAVAGFGNCGVNSVAPVFTLVE
jgi:hypothetical protein